MHAGERDLGGDTNGTTFALDCLDVDRVGPARKKFVAHVLSEALDMTLAVVVVVGDIEAERTGGENVVGGSDERVRDGCDVLSRVRANHVVEDLNAGVRLVGNGRIPRLGVLQVGGVVYSVDVDCVLTLGVADDVDTVSCEGSGEAIESEALGCEGLV